MRSLNSRFPLSAERGPPHPKHERKGKLIAREKVLLVLLVEKKGARKEHKHFHNRLNNENMSTRKWNRAVF
jgi:hypothetical protein